MHTKTLDRIEKLFVDRELSPAQIAKRFPSLNLTEREIRDALIDAGLEVEGQVKADYTPSGLATGAQCRATAVRV